MTAAAFAKGLLALEGELTPILVQVSNIFWSLQSYIQTRIVKYTKTFFILKNFQVSLVQNAFRPDVIFLLFLRHKIKVFFGYLRWSNPPILMAFWTTTMIVPASTRTCKLFFRTFLFQVFVDFWLVWELGFHFTLSQFYKTCFLK
jgi:hypothetical protein